VPAWTQKAATKFEKGFPFGQWKRYAWREKKLFSHQLPEDQNGWTTQLSKQWTAN
jgi:hypothetical protein